MSIAVVGSIGLDTIQTPAGRVNEVLGGSAAYFSLAARHFMPVSLVAVVGKDFPREARALLDQPDVDLAGLEVQDGKTFRWEGVYSADMNTRETIRTELNVFERFKPDLSERTRSLKNVFLANIDPVLQRDVLEQLDQPRLVLADTMNYWIRTKKDELLQTLKKVRIVIINEEEARELTGEALTHKAARAILSLGPETVVIKQGEHGAFLQGPEVFFTCPAYPIDNVIDPTGAGDTFAGGFVGALARMARVNDHNLRRAVVYGCVLASFTVEGFGVSGLAHADRDSILARAEAISDMTKFNLSDTARILR
ncbi:MAG TPA: PfkB family carbohydrate kinase [Candidatus Eisenbacteria bacterium]|nr:PfkB family carbohydrate kinase [Candidatus Eisenbacteria bacterium]